MSSNIDNNNTVLRKTSPSSSCRINAFLKYLLYISRVCLIILLHLRTSTFISHNNQLIIRCCYRYYWCYCRCNYSGDCCFSFLVFLWLVFDYCHLFLIICLLLFCWGYFRVCFCDSYRCRCQYYTCCCSFRFSRWRCSSYIYRWYHSSDWQYCCRCGCFCCCCCYLTAISFFLVLLPLASLQSVLPLLFLFLLFWLIIHDVAVIFLAVIVQLYE